MTDAQTLWLDTVEFARRNLLRMNDEATDDEVNALARKIYFPLEKILFVGMAVGRKNDRPTRNR